MNTQLEEDIDRAAMPVPGIRILLASASDAFATALQAMLTDLPAGWAVVRAADRQLAWQSLPGCDVCLLDAWMPGSSALLVRAADFGVGTPIIWVGESEDLVASAVLLARAADNLSLDALDRPLLLRSLHYVLDRARTGRLLNETRNRLVENARTLQGLLADFRDALLVRNEAGVLVYANTAAGALFGAPPASLTGQLAPGLHFVNEGIYEVTLDIAGQPHTLEVQVSDTAWDGQPAQLIALRDMTASRTTEDHLRLAQRAIAATGNGIAIADATLPGMPLVYVNPALERVSGYPASELLGKSCCFLAGADSGAAPEVLAEVRRALSVGESCNVVLRNYRKDGTAFWNELHLSPVLDRDGQVSHYIAVQNDVSEAVCSREALEQIAHRDPLTGLLNPQGLGPRLAERLRQARAQGNGLAVFYVDLDRFRPINDALGHVVGDEAIIAVARRLEAEFGEHDLVARSSGDEFVLAITDVDGVDAAAVLAQRIIGVVARSYELSSSSVYLTCSIGVSLDDGALEDAMLLVQRADIAMYRAKNAGRNAWELFRDEMAERTRQALALRGDLQRALEEQAFVVHYQPQVDARNGRLQGVEALVRWQHPERGMITPDEFVGVAEDTGQMIGIGRFVLERACRDCRALLAGGLCDISLSVNISPVQFGRGSFVTIIEDVLRETDFPPVRLEIEITESVLLDDFEGAVRKIEMLKRMGVRVALDDFGKGFSSLYYLRSLPVNKVKIDRSFIRDVISDARAAAVTQGIVSMAHHLGLQVTAEGVETEAQRDFLRKSGCDQFQGFLVSQALPLAELEAWIRRSHIDEPSPAIRTDGDDAPSLLLVDDEPNILRALSRLLRRDGYRIFTAGSAREAFAILASNDIQVIISDQRMPEMCGTVFLSQVKDLYPDTIRIVLSGYTDLQTVTDAINEGAIYRFLTKPWNDEALREDVRRAVNGLARAGRAA